MRALGDVAAEFGKLFLYALEYAAAWLDDKARR